MRFRDYSCGKVRDFLDSHRARWMQDNLSVEEVKALYNKVRECSPAAANGIYKVMKFIIDTIENRK